MPENASDRTMTDKLQSRKFIATVLGVLWNAYMVQTGALPAKEATQYTIALLIAFVLGQALVDSGLLQGMKLQQLSGFLTALNSSNGKTPEVQADPAAPKGSNEGQA